MKKIILGIFCLFTSFTSVAQDSPKVQELGLVFRNLDNFGVTYRVGTEKSLWRFRATTLSGRISRSDVADTDRSSTNHGLSVIVGREYRKALENNFEFRYGMGLGFGFQVENEEEEDLNNVGQKTEIRNFRYSPSLRFIVGVNYVVSEKWVFGAELLPFVSYQITDRTVDGTNFSEPRDESISVWTYSVSNQTVSLSVLYRF
jgi:hypothetical protein